MTNSTSQQPLGGIKVYIGYAENFGLITVTDVNVGGFDIPLHCFSADQLELWRIDIQIEFETEERQRIALQAELFALNAE